MTSLVGKICLVTGGTRGIGKGICTQLANAGSTCYVTGRNKNDLDELNIRNWGSGQMIAVECDHSNDEEVVKVFKRIKKDHGNLDLLVNNAFSGIQFSFDNARVNYWEHPLESYDALCSVGLRSHYISAQLASKMMVKQKKGIIANVSSLGASTFMFTPLYGVCKCAGDRMVRDCSYQLKEHNVAFISYWPSPVKTELLSHDMEKIKPGVPSSVLGNTALRWMMENGQTPSSCGDAFVKLLELPHEEVMKISGKVIPAWSFAKKHHLVMENGKLPPNMLGAKVVMNAYGFKKSAKFVPEFVSFPHWLLMPLSHIVNKPIHTP